MSSRFLSHLVVIVVLNLLVKPAYILAIEATVQNRVGAETYGLYFALLNSAYLFQVLNDFGISVYNNRLVAIDALNLRALFLPLLKVKALLGVAFIAALYLFAVVMGYDLELDILFPIAINLILTSLILFFRSNISGLGMYRKDSFLSVADKAIMIVLCGVLLIYFDADFTIYHFIYAQMASLAFTLIMTGILLAGSVNTPPGSTPPISVGKLLRSAFPYALTVFLMGIYTRIDGVMIEQIDENGSYSAGMYAAGYRLLDAANMLGYLFAVLLLPMFSSLLKNSIELKKLLSQGFQAIWVFTLTISVGGFFFRRDIMFWLYTEATDEWSRIFGVLILSFISVGLMYVFGTYLVARGNVKALNILYGGCALANIGLNFTLIPIHGAYGAAVATLITQGLVAVCLIVMTLRSIEVSISAMYITRPVAFLLLTTGLCYLVRTFLTILPWWIQLLLTGVTLTGVGIALGLISLQSLRARISGP